MARVLVAESDDDLQRMIEFSLVRAGHEVTAVAEGGAALTTGGVAAPDLFILDTMPDIGGVELCEALRDNPATATSPIIILTGMAQVSEIDRGLASGADEYLVKPFSPRNLLTHVAALLEWAKHPGTPVPRAVA